MSSSTPDKSPAPDDQTPKPEIPPDADTEMLDLVGRRLDLVLRTPPAPHISQLMQVPDAVFRIVEDSERAVEEKPDFRTRELFPTSAHSGHPVIHEEELAVPVPAAVGLLVGALIADKHHLSAEERDRLRQDEIKRILAQISAARFDFQRLVATNTVWRALSDALAVDQANNDHIALEILREGLPPQVLDSREGFSVNVRSNRVQQVAEILSGMLIRLQRLCGEDRRTVQSEIAGWEKWKNRLLVPTAADIPSLMSIYKNVRIPYKWYKDLLSSQPEVKEKALARIRQYGGFIHEPCEADFQLLMKHGVLRMTDDRSAYYGVLTDETVTRQHLQKMCGFDPAKMYESIDDLPAVSGSGWPLEWNADPALALTMFNHPDHVALSWEVAVMREESQQTGGGKGRRNAGIAAALKDGVYRDPQVDNTYVLTRHFQIVEVSLPETKRNPEPVSGAINVGSDIFIRLLGGREIGSARERCTIMAYDDQGNPHPVELTIRWIFCLAPRLTSLDVIENRKQRI